MAYNLTKQSDGDISLGNLRAELIPLGPSVSDYATGGYLIQGIGGTTEATGNVGMDKVLFVIPVGGQQGYNPVWQTSTSKMAMFEDSGAVGPFGQVPALTDLSAYTFELLVVGY